MFVKPLYIYALSFAVGIGAHVGISTITNTQTQLIEKVLLRTTENHLLAKYTQRSDPY